MTLLHDFALLGVSFSSVNVLDYPPIREGIKNFS